MNTKLKQLSPVLVGLAIVACGNEAMRLMGDAAVDAGETLRDAAGLADAAALEDASEPADSGRPPSMILSATCEVSTDGVSRIAQWTVPDLNPATVRIVRMRFCGPTGDFGPPEARAQECEVGGYGAFVSEDTLVAPCFLYTTAEIELEI